MIRQVDGAYLKPRRLCKTAHQRKTGHRGCKDTYEHKIKQRFGRQNEFAFMIAPPKEPIGAKAAERIRLVRP